MQGDRHAIGSDIHSGRSRCSTCSRRSGLKRAGRGLNSMGSVVLLLATIGVLQNGPSIPRPEDLVNVRNVRFDPMDGSVDYRQIVALGVTAYRTEILWRLADGSVATEPIDIEWFLGNAFSYVSNGMVVNPLSAQTLVPSTPSRPSRYVRKPTVPITSQPIDAQVVVVAAVHRSGIVFGDRTVLAEMFKRRQALLNEYDHWTRVIDAVWQDDSPIATLRLIVPEVQKARRTDIGEGVRNAIRKAAESMLFSSERDLADAPRLLNALVSSIEQQRQLLLQQSQPNSLATAVPRR